MSLTPDDSLAAMAAAPDIQREIRQIAKEFAVTEADGLARVERKSLFRNLRESLCRLAADGAVALASLPDGCCKADEFALDWENYWTAVISNFGDDLPSDLVVALAEVDAELLRVQGDEWSDEAVLSSPTWTRIRERARVALTLLDRVVGSVQETIE